MEVERKVLLSGKASKKYGTLATREILKVNFEGESVQNHIRRLLRENKMRKFKKVLTN